MRHSTVSQRRF